MLQIFLAVACGFLPPVQDSSASLAGTWRLAYTLTAELEAPVCLIRLESRKGELTGRVLAAAPRKGEMTLARPHQDDGHVRLVFQGTAGEQSFEGRLPPASGQALLGSYSFGGRLFPARLTRTTETALPKAALVTRQPLPPLVRQLVKLTGQDVSAERTTLAEAPRLLDEVLAQHAASPVVFDPALRLLVSAGRLRVAPAQAARWAAALARAAELYGPRWQAEVSLHIAEALAPHTDFAATALHHARQAAEKLADGEPAARQVRVLRALAVAEEKTGRTKEASQSRPRLAKLEEVLDADYRTRVPPLKVTAFPGQGKKVGRTVVVELFTGSHCPFCAAAYLVFEALRRGYPPSELLLIQYHLHRSGPDPLANPDAAARWDYYMKLLPAQARTTPALLVNGQDHALGGHLSHGPKQADLHREAKKKYNLLSELIDRLAEEPAGASLTVGVERQGDVLLLRVAVRGLAGPGDTKRLRLVLTEEQVRHAGSNGLRFHHHVARALPGGANGFALVRKDSQHSIKIDLAELRGQLHRHLDEHADRVRPFPTLDRPLDLTKLRVIAFVQDDQTGEIVQASVADVPGAAKP